MSIGKLAVLAVALALASGGIGAALADWNERDHVAPIVLTGEIPSEADRDGGLRRATNGNRESFIGRTYLDRQAAGKKSSRTARPSRTSRRADIGTSTVANRAAQAPDEVADVSSADSDDEERVTSAARQGGDSRDDDPAPTANAGAGAGASDNDDESAQAAAGGRDDDDDAAESTPTTTANADGATDDDGGGTGSGDDDDAEGGAAQGGAGGGDADEAGDD
jgi:hypothetical protein